MYNASEVLHEKDKRFLKKKVVRNRVIYLTIKNSGLLVGGDGESGCKSKMME